MKLASFNGNTVTERMSPGARAHFLRYQLQFAASGIDDALRYEMSEAARVRLVDALAVAKRGLNEADEADDWNKMRRENA